MGDEGANAVAVAIHRQVDRGLGFGVTIDAGAQGAGAVDEAKGLSGLEGPSPNPGDQHTRGAVVEVDLHALREIEDLGESRGVRKAGLGRFPFPKGRGLEKNRAVLGDAQGADLEHDLDPRAGAGDVHPVAGDPPGPAAAVRGRAGGGDILLEQGLGLEFGIDGKPRSRVGDGRFLGRGKGCGMGCGHPRGTRITAHANAGDQECPEERPEKGWGPGAEGCRVHG